MPPHAKDDGYLDAVIPKRIAFFERIQAEQRAHLDSLPHDSHQVKDGKRWATRPIDVAAEISKSLASNALISRVNGSLWDMARPLEGDCDLQLFTFKSDEGRDTFWHSSAHILGEALEQEYGCKLCIGPCTKKDEGFYYDAFYGDLGLSNEHFEAITGEVLKAVEQKQPFERIEVTRDQALEMFSDNNFKVEIIKDLPADKTINVCRCGPLVDLCQGPHIPNTFFVKAFACLKASSAYWRGNKDRESLQRVCGISFPDDKLLKKHLEELEEAKMYDHRTLGLKQELFFSHELSPGSWFFQPHGTDIYNQLQEFIRVQYRNRGYEEVKSSDIYKMELWETSGHAAKYKENMFLLEIEKQEFGLKPMNWPGHCLMFKERERSYRELPMRWADFGALHRNEASGALSGLTRVRRFQQDDAHIFCRESQVKEEVKNVLEFIDYCYQIFGFTYELKLSTRPENYVGEFQTWDKAEGALKEALDQFGKPWKVNEGDSAFYGPKIDISVSDALKRKFQCATLQLDFQLPQRFELEYVAEDEVTRERPVMIHRAILGSVERMFAILLEHYKGKWPFWLSPRQKIVCPVSAKSQAYAEVVQRQIHEAGYFVNIDLSDRKIQKKVREAQLAQYNYILVVGEEEAGTGQVSVRARDTLDHKITSMESLLQLFKSEVEQVHKDRESRLQRVYGIFYPDNKQLKEYLKRLEEAEMDDHVRLGMKQELFCCHHFSPGIWSFKPHGTRVYKRLKNFVRVQYKNRGYKEVKSPDVYSTKLWETSGDAAKYKENMFLLEIEKQEFGLKSMNCPSHCLFFQQRVRSYRELPMRLVDFGALHPNEASGALTGLTCVRRFEQDNAHIYCQESQIKEEVKNVLEFMDFCYQIFGFTYELKLSTRPEDYLGQLESWDRAEGALKEALDQFGKPWQVDEGDGAIYGPKIDISVSDASKRKFQCATLQLDFELPRQFKLEYSAEDEAKRERPVMIHSAILGSVERMFAILLEHYKGKWPFWLSPRQAIVCPVSAKSRAYAEVVLRQIHEAGYFVDILLSDMKIQEKVREAQQAQYNYILVVGEEEAGTGQVSVLVGHKSDHSPAMSMESLLEHLKSEVEQFL